MTTEPQGILTNSDQPMHPRNTGQLFLAILLLLFLPWFRPAPAAGGDLEVERQVVHDLRQSKVLVRQMADLRQTGAPFGPRPARLKGLAASLAARRQQLNKIFDVRREVTERISPTALARHARMAEKYQAKISEYLALVDAISGSNFTPLQLEELKSLLDSLAPERDQPLLGALPYRHLNLAGRQPAVTPAHTPAFLGGDKTVTEADLAASLEAPVTAEIVALAESLAWNPVAIHAWVKNNIKTEWYWGSMKGAVETLHQGSGNDTDQAELLVALLRAAGFPARFVRGTVEFFPDLTSAENLTGLSGGQAILGFFQKAGIPAKALIGGGKIANLQVEHIWVEAEIPYANYRGVVIDEHGKSWLGLDPSFKVGAICENQPLPRPAGYDLNTFRQRYLAEVRSATPLEFLRGELVAAGAVYEDLLYTRTVPPEELQILPASLQFKTVAVTGEFASLPAELRHRARFTATAGTTSFFDLTLPVPALASRSIAVIYEPVTVEDQEIINSYGGLANTPAYLVRLRPVLTVDGERLAIGTSGLAVGEDFTFAVELLVPNGHSERLENRLTIGNIAVLGLAAQGVTVPTPIPLAEKSGERLLHERALDYLDHWNQAENELAALLGITIARPLPSLVSLGGVVEVVTLLDQPHGFDWKGVYLDADFRAVEGAGGTAEDYRLFLQLAGLQGSLLESRVFEEAFGVDSVSTAKLLALSNSDGLPPLVLDQANMAAELPALALPANIEADITHAVYQGQTVTIPPGQSSYEDWLGYGYLKEDPDTGEAGWMLSGVIGGGMTALNPDRWPEEYYDSLANPFNDPPNRDPGSGIFIQKIIAADLQVGMVGKPLPKNLQVYISDRNQKPVKGAEVIFTVMAGGGTLADRNHALTGQSTLSAITDHGGIAEVELTAGQRTVSNPYLLRKNPSDPYHQMVGNNIVTATLASGTINVTPSAPFTAWGFPDVPVKIAKVQGDGAAGLPNSSAGQLQAQILDRYDNPVANHDLTFTVQPAQSAVSGVALPTGLANFRNLTLYEPEHCSEQFPTLGRCPELPEVTIKTTYQGTGVGAIFGNTGGTKYGVKVVVASDGATAGGFAEEFSLMTSGARYGCPEDPLLGASNCDDPVGKLLPPGLFMRIVADSTSGGVIPATTVNKALAPPITVELFKLVDEFTQESYQTVDERGHVVTRWRVRAIGIVRYEPVADGIVSFTALNGGSCSPAVNLGDGRYQSTYTPDSQPGLARIAIEGSATVTVPEFYLETFDRNYSAPLSIGYPEQIGERNIALKSGQFVLFDPVIPSAEPPHPVVFDPSGGTTQYLDVHVAGVEPEQQGYLGIVDKDGYLREDLRIGYRIIPADYQAGNAKVEISKRKPGESLEPVLYLDSERSGAGFATLMRGFRFELGFEYVARIILNYGTAVEISSEEIQLIPGVARIVSNDTEKRDMLGATTDGLSTVLLRLEVKNNRDSLPLLVWSHEDHDQPSSGGGVGTLLDATGDPAAKLPVVFDVDGVAEVVYQAPQNFVRHGTTQEAADKERPVRFIRVKLNDSAAGLPELVLKRPPVLLVHGLWGDGRKEEGTYTWKEFEGLLNTTGVFDIYSVNYHKTNADSIASNEAVVEENISKPADSLNDLGYAASQVDIIAHSMGGLLVREYCRQNPSECAQNIRKFITIDTPHAGSELADILVIFKRDKSLIDNVFNFTPPYYCHSAVEAFVSGSYELFGIPVVSSSPHPIDRGAIDDLASGRWTEAPFSSVSSGSWSGMSEISSQLHTHTIVGVATANHDSDIAALWNKVLGHCDFTRARVFGAQANTNDRIVTESSQRGGLAAEATENISGADHFSILHNVYVVARVKTLLDESLLSNSFSLGH